VLAELFLRRRVGEFVYPIAPVPRTAVLVPWFRDLPSGGSNICIFPRGWTPIAVAFAPASIAATIDQLVALGSSANGQSPPPVTHAIIVLARPGARGITESQRDWLWKRFRVPVFEQVIGPAGELVAGECEAHDGLHADASEPMLKGEAFDGSPCPCGRKTPRIRALRGAELEHRMAAYAR